MKIRIVSKSGIKPSYATSQSAGFDLPAYLPERDIVLKPGERALVPTGIFMEIPEGFEVQIRARSGLAVKHGIGLVNGIGTIDADYRGEIKVPLINWGDSDFTVRNAERIAQAVVSKFETCEFELTDSLNCTERGAGGFGHSGV